MCIITVGALKIKGRIIDLSGERFRPGNRVEYGTLLDELTKLRGQWAVDGQEN